MKSRIADALQQKLTKAAITFERTLQGSAHIFAIALEGRADLHAEVRIVGGDMSLYLATDYATQYRGGLQEPRDAIALVRVWQRRALKGKTP